MDELDTCILYDGETQVTLRGELPYEIDGLHWKFATDQARRVAAKIGSQAIGVRDHEEIARGYVMDVRGSSDVAIVDVEPPDSGEQATDPVMRI